MSAIDFVAGCLGGKLSRAHFLSFDIFQCRYLRHTTFCCSIFNKCDNHRDNAHCLCFVRRFQFPQTDETLFIACKANLFVLR